MSNPDYHIIPYSEEYNDLLIQFEKRIVQGKNVQLEIIKEHFLSRAKAFKHSYACMALAKDGKVVGLAIGAVTTIRINMEQHNAGFGFDTKVAPGWRNKGVGRMLAKEIYKQFFVPMGLSKNFMTAKIANAPVLRLISNALTKVWLFDFIYLTIPTTARLQKPVIVKVVLNQFKVELYEKENISSDYYTCFENGLCYLDTYKLYKLRIKKISRLYKTGIKLLKMLYPSKYSILQGENEIISFVTLYNHTPENIGGINTVLERLEMQGINQLQVCCKKNDAVYQTLQKMAIYKYKYHVISDFILNKDDCLTMDVRCL